MSSPEYLSPLQVSQALGVSVTTVKRWVDDGLMPAYKTPGGHRKLMLADVIRFLRDNPLPHADLSLLSLPHMVETAPDPRAVADRVLVALEQGNPETVRSLLEAAYQAGLSMEALADDVIAPVMHAIGHQWEHQEIDVYQEHRCTQHCVEAIHQFKAVLDDNAEQGRPVAVGGAPEGDPYLLASLMCQMVLSDNGWNAINLGPNTPIDSFRRALEDYQPRLLWVSVSYLSDPERFRREYEVLFRQARAAGVKVALGGQALADQAFRELLNYTHHGDKLCHLAEFARSLHPRPRKPRRGRPPLHSR